MHYLGTRDVQRHSRRFRQCRSSVTSSSKISLSRMSKRKQENIPNPFPTPSPFARFLLPKSPISAAKAKPSLVYFGKHNGSNMVCFDEQTPKLIHASNSLTKWASGMIQSRVFRNAKIVRNRQNAWIGIPVKMTGPEKLLFYYTILNSDSWSNSMQNLGLIYGELWVICFDSFFLLVHFAHSSPTEDKILIQDISVK